MAEVQRQNGGELSTNLQAGGNIVYQGLTLAEARQVALDVFHANFLELRGIAEDVAAARAERITTDFINKLSVEAPERMRAFEDPDVQRAMFNAQQEFACSGEDDLEQVLVDLLLSRAHENGRTLRTIALNEAIGAVAKLTLEQRVAIALVFLGRYARYVGPLNLEALYSGHLRHFLAVSGAGVPTRDVDYQHIEFVGAGSVSISERKFGKAVLSGNEGYFTHGFTADDAPDPIRSDIERISIPCIRDAARRQFGVVGFDDLSTYSEKLGVSEHLEDIKKLATVGLMTEDQVRDEVVERVPEIRELAKQWDSTNLRRLTLTSVGIAMGHAYFTRVAGVNVSLGVWL